MSKLLLSVFFSLAACSAQTARVTIVNACCQSISDLQFTIQGNAETVSLAYGLISSPLIVTLGQNNLQVSAGQTVLYTSGSLSLVDTKEYTLVFSGTIGAYQLIGPIENMTMGDVTKPRFRFALLSPFVQQGSSEVHLKILCPSGSSVDIKGIDQNFTPYVDGPANLQETCRIQVVKTVSGMPVVAVEKALFLSIGNNYTVLSLGQNAASLDVALVVDSR